MMSLSEKEAFQAMKHRENMERKELEMFKSPDFHKYRSDDPS